MVEKYPSTSKGIQIDQNQLLKKGWIQPGGLILSNNATSPATDVDINAGSCGDSTGARVLTATAKTKLLDTAWDEGNGAGGLLSGSTFGANKTFHAHAFEGSSGVDIGFSESLTPTLPSGYDEYRRHVGSVCTDGNGDIIPFYTDDGNFYSYGSGQVIFTGTSGIPTVRTPYSIAIPNGYAVRPILQGKFMNIDVLRCNIIAGLYVNDVQGDELVMIDTFASPTVAEWYEYAPALCPGFTNSSAQIDFRCSNSTANYYIFTCKGYQTNREAFS